MSSPDDAGGGSAAGGPVALVSGGSRGLGRAVVERLLEQGWRVATFSREESEFIKIQRDGGRLWWAGADLQDLGAVRGVVGGAVQAFGGVDLLVNNAALLTQQELFLTLRAAELDRLVTCNLMAPIVLAQACSRVMSTRGGGHILNVSSVNAVRGYRGVAVYSATKAGLDGLTRSLARELGPLNIRVNSIVPGFFESDMTQDISGNYRESIQKRTPLGRLGSITEIVDTVTYLTSPAASFITGQSIIVDGGITC